MGRLIQHRPGFGDGYEPAGWKAKKIEFKNYEEFISDPWMKELQEKEGFYRFSVDDDYLIAEFNEGKDWIIVGGFFDAWEVMRKLPKWEPKK